MNTNITDDIDEPYNYSFERYWVYILRCSDNTYYVGMTNKLRRRIFRHQYIDKYAAEYVKSRRPLTLVCVIPCDNYRDAIDMESFINSLDREQKEGLIAEWEKRKQEMMKTHHI